MAQVFLYPATGESPLDEDGNPFPSTGLRVTMNAYYEGQCRQGLLVRQDPSAFSSVAQPAVYAPFSLGYVTTQLSSIAGGRDGRVISTAGYEEPGDGGGGDWAFAAGVSAGENGYTKRNCSDGQWQRLPTSPLTFREFGAKLDSNGAAGNGTDDTAAIQAAFDALSEFSPNAELIPCTRQVGSPRLYCRITNTVTVPGTANGSGLVSGGPGEGQAYNPLTFVWDRPGAADRPMFSVECNNTIFQNLTWAVAAGRNLLMYVNIQGGGTYTVTKNRWERCQFVGSGSIGNVQDLVTIDYYVNSVNIEDHQWLDCAFYDFTRYAIGVFGGQAYKTKVSDCFILQSHASLIRKGVGIYSPEDSFNGVIERTFFYKVEAMVAGQGVNWVIRDCTSEGCKRLFDGQGFTGYGSALIIEGGRHALDGLTEASTGPRVIAAGDRYFIIQQGANSINVRGVHFDYGASDLNMLIASGNATCAIVSEGNTYPTLTPFQPADAGVFSTGDIYQGASGSAKIPPRSGRLNPDGVITISGANTTGAVTFAQTEPDPNYVPILTVLPGTGAAAADSRIAWPTAITTTGFTINLRAAPGVGTDVNVSYRLVPRNP